MLHTPYNFPLLHGPRALWELVGRVKCASYSESFEVFELVSEGRCVLMAVFTASCVFISLDAILTSWRKMIDGHCWRCRKIRSEARYVSSLLSSLLPSFGALKNDVIDGWRKGEVPLMFHEKMRGGVCSKWWKNCRIDG